MNKKCYNIKEIVSISALAGLFLFMPFSTTKLKNSTTASEEITQNLKQTKITNTEIYFPCKTKCNVEYKGKIDKFRD